MPRAKSDPRHRAREAALQILYQWEVGRSEVESAAATFFGHQWPDAATPPEPLREFAVALAQETVSRLEAVDRLIADTAEHWRPERMAIVDRLILRMAIAELLRDPDTPRPVIINEALELARTFSTEDSVKFINGMLDAVNAKLKGKSQK